MGGRSGQSTNSRVSAISKLDSLPAGKIFDDAKNISSVFGKSTKTWSEVVEAFEENVSKAKTEFISIKSIKITQPNIQVNKVKQMVVDIKNVPTINVVQFKNGERAIFDGHHRLLANWAMGNKKIKVNIVRL